MTNLSNTDIYIERISHRDFEPIIQITNEQLGINYLTSNRLQLFLDFHKSIGLVAKANHKVVGFSLLKLCTFVELTQEIGEPYAQLIEPFRNHNLICFRKTMAVHKAYMNMGVASQLIKAATPLTKEAESVCSLAWKSKFGVNIEKLMINNGFKPMGEIKDYWKSESLSTPFICPVCGNPPCVCSTIIYGKFNPELP